MGKSVFSGDEDEGASSPHASGLDLDHRLQITLYSYLVPLVANWLRIIGEIYVLLHICLGTFAPDRRSCTCFCLLQMLITFIIFPRAGDLYKSNCWSTLYNYLYRSNQGARASIWAHARRALSVTWWAHVRAHVRKHVRAHVRAHGGGHMSWLGNC